MAPPSSRTAASAARRYEAPSEGRHGRDQCRRAGDNGDVPIHGLGRLILRRSPHPGTGRRFNSTRSKRSSPQGGSAARCPTSGGASPRPELCSSSSRSCPICRTPRACVARSTYLRVCLDAPQPDPPRHLGQSQLANCLLLAAPASFFRRWRKARNIHP